MCANAERSLVAARQVVWTEKRFRYLMTSYYYTHRMPRREGLLLCIHYYHRNYLYIYLYNIDIYTYTYINISGSPIQCERSAFGVKMLSFSLNILWWAWCEHSYPLWLECHCLKFDQSLNMQLNGIIYPMVCEESIIAKQLSSYVAVTLRSIQIASFEFYWNMNRITTHTEWAIMNSHNTVLEWCGGNIWAIVWRDHLFSLFIIQIFNIWVFNWIWRYAHFIRLE